MLTVCTGWSPAGYLEYGLRFFETFDAYWPTDVDLVVYGEERVALQSSCGRRTEFRLLSTIPDCMEFLKRNDNARARGQAPDATTAAKWKPKHYAARYNFRFDAWKFCRQGFIPFDAMQNIAVSGRPKRDFLCWLDGDVVTHARVPQGAIESLLPEGKHVAYLGRGAKHSEIGFQLYDVSGIGAWDSSDCWPAVQMLRAFREIYARDEVFTLKEWHSAFVFDEARRRTGVAGHDLTPGGEGHVWHQSPLRAWTDHLKGKRKAKGRSDERKN